MATKSKKTLEKAIRLKKNSTAWYTQLQQVVRDEIKSIRGNRDYTLSAKEKMIRELKRKRGVEILQVIDKRKQAYVRLLERARKEAEDTIYSKVKKPDDEKIHRFNTDLKHLKTKLLLAKNKDEMEKHLNAFVRKIEIEGEDRAYFASALASEFAEIVPMLLNVDSSLETKLNLDKLYDHLYYNLQPDEVKEAREVYDTAEHLLQNPTIFNGFLVEDNAKELLGFEFSMYINKPEAFFEQAQNQQYKQTYSEKELDDYVKSELGEDSDHDPEWERWQQKMKNMDKITQEKIASGELKL